MRVHTCIYQMAQWFWEMCHKTLFEGVSIGHYLGVLAGEIRKGHALRWSSGVEYEGLVRRDGFIIRLGCDVTSFQDFDLHTAVILTPPLWNGLKLMIWGVLKHMGSSPYRMHSDLSICLLPTLHNNLNRIIDIFIVMYHVLSNLTPVWRLGECVHNGWHPGRLELFCEGRNENGFHSTCSLKFTSAAMDIIKSEWRVWSTGEKMKHVSRSCAQMKIRAGCLPAHMDS